MARKPLLLGLIAVFTLGNLAVSLAPSYETLVAARFVAGLPHGAFFGVATLVAAHYGTAEPCEGGRTCDVRLDDSDRGRRAGRVVAGPGAGLADRVRTGGRRSVR